MINSRVIIACDFSSWDELISFLNKFNGEKLFLKIGYQLFFTIGIEKIKQLQSMGHNIFLDLKLHEIRCWHVNNSCKWWHENDECSYNL